MLFNSIDFILFFIVVTTLYFVLPFKFRIPMLLIASCYFYMDFVPIYITILFGTIIIDYFAGILIEKSKGRKRKLYLVLSLISNIGILCFFKYFNFLNANLSDLLQLFDVKMESQIWVSCSLLVFLFTRFRQWVTQLRFTGAIKKVNEILLPTPCMWCFIRN